MNVCVTFAIFLVLSGTVSCKWCTRLKAEVHVQTLTEFSECKQAYHAACGWFTSSVCTYYEMVPCAKERNHTVQQYKIVSECCPGYTLDPINNITCILMPSIHADGRSDQSVQYYVSDNDLFLGLSPGAYAGIICSFLFAICVAVLITLHVLKRKRISLKAKENKMAEVEISEKMISTA
jgi:hypothetical protein